MKFGIYLRNKQNYDDMKALAVQADELGYYGAFLNDHVIGFGDEGQEPYLEAWTTMTGIGVETKNIRVGHIVLFNSLRNPAYLAKSIATLDNMTNGRYELLIGAGWNEREYNGYDLMGKGRGMPSAGERVDRFKESIEILNLMLSQEITTYNGDYWQLDEAINIPQPVQTPFRLSVGCKGSRMMKITAKHAQGVNLSGGFLPDVEDLIQKFKSTIDQYTDNSIRDYFISGFSGIEITEDLDRLNQLSKSRAKQKEITEQNARNNSLFGTADEVVTKLQKLQNEGMDMMVTSITVDENLSDNPLAYFKDNVVNEL